MLLFVLSVAPLLRLHVGRPKSEPVLQELLALSVPCLIAEFLPVAAALDAGRRCLDDAGLTIHEVSVVALLAQDHVKHRKDLSTELLAKRVALLVGFISIPR